MSWSAEGRKEHSYHAARSREAFPTWTHRDQERVDGTGAAFAREATFVINLVLDSELLGLVDSTSTTRTALDNLEIIGTQW